MFDDDDWVPSWISLGLQSILAYWAPLIAAMLLESSLRVHFSPFSAAEHVVNYGLIALLAVALAFGVSTFFADSADAGRWVWVLPVAVVLFCFFWELSSHGLSEATLLFYIGDPTMGEAGWGMVLLTMPAWSCCSYSAAMYCRRRLQQRSASSSGQGVDP